MQESLITKKVIAYSLKKIMQDTPFSKVTIREIMAVAEIRRQTFYDHFQDKYELLSWIYQQDISENISDFLDYEEWQKIIFRILDYFKANQIFYRNALEVTEQNSFDHYFLAHTQGLLNKITHDLAAKQTFQATKTSLDFSAAFYSHAFVGVTKEWLLAGCPSEPNALAKDITATLEKSFTGFLQ